MEAGNKVAAQPERSGNGGVCSLEGPALMVENADVEAELLASDGGSREGLLKGSCGPGLDGGCWMVCRWLSVLE